MTSSPVPLIYVRDQPVAQVSPLGRLLAAAIAIACASVLGLAAWLPPNPRGVSTHTRLGLQPCQFMARTGLPCPSCGMTTSFSWFARGNIEASLYVQPMGTILAFLVAATFWAAAYIALTAKPAHRLALRIPARYYLWYLPAVAILAWGWKMWIHLHGKDGWP